MQLGKDQGGDLCVEGVHVPGGFLRKGKQSIEFGEKCFVSQVKVAMATLAERSAGQVRHVVVGSSNGPGGQWGALCDQVLDGQGPNQALANQGSAGGETTGPGDCGGVVTPGSGMLVDQCLSYLFQN